MKSMTLNIGIDGRALLRLPDTKLKIEGLNVSIHDLAKGGWECRIVEKRYISHKFRVSFSHGKSTITAIVRAPSRDVAEILSLVSDCTMTVKAIKNPLADYSDLQLLRELRKRNKVVRRKRVTNVIDFEKYLQQKLSENEQLNYVREK